MRRGTEVLVVDKPRDSDEVYLFRCQENEIRVLSGGGRRISTDSADVTGIESDGLRDGDESRVGNNTSVYMVKGVRSGAPCKCQATTARTRLNQSLRVRGWMIAGSSGRLLQKTEAVQWHSGTSY